jgi:ATP-dependent Lhr-like helicase
MSASNNIGDNGCMSSFSPLVRDWFIESIGEPSEPQRRGWPETASGRNVLICAPTGSGKTFAAFLKCLDLIYTDKMSEAQQSVSEGADKKPVSRSTGVRIVYISPLKALNNDIYRNLELPIKGIKQKAEAEGMEMPDIKVAVRTGDTPQKERSRMLKDPPDILITTPESLFIMLTADSYRKLFSTVEYLIVDEIHSICANKRGVHLSVSIERLERLAGKPLKRIGLTATVNPLEEAAAFLCGSRSVTVVNCDHKRAFDLMVSLPVKDLKVLPENTIWPAVYAELMTLVKAHRSTLIFVNNRRVAEMVAAGLNMLADEPFVRTHHGSVSREIRQELERQLKEGEITCLVATSSLELGIDIGSIDLVVQISAPGTVSQVLQRIGRSGHRLDAVSKGVIIPKTRGDLLDSSFASYQAKRYDIENIKVPQNCLDILAQHIVSISCEGEQDKAEIFNVIRKSYPYRDLPERQFEDVLLMLADPSPADAPGSVKPRVYYDRGTGKVRGTPVGKRMCLMGGGTIPDKGNYNVYLNDTGIRIGELQEEFVFESRIGDRFFLGSSVWRVERIEKDRVIVSPSNASGAKIPFWIGDKTFRSYETGMKFGKYLLMLENEHSSVDFSDIMDRECGLDRTAAENLRTYIADQLSVTKHLPSSERIICEYFSDETGDRRIIVHTPFGGRVHAPLAVLLNSKLSRLLNCRIEYIYNNDGILFHIFGYTGRLSNLFSLLDRESMENEIFELLPEDPLFNINLRYNLTRSLLVEIQGFGKRNPLWIQRLRCAETAGKVLKQQDHPAVVETYRECLNDIFDIKSLYKIIEDISTGKIQVTDVYTENASPFSTELLFNFWQIYQYNYDLPVAERRNQLLVNDRDFIQLAAGLNAEYELLDPRAIAEVQSELLKYKYERRFRNADELYFFLYSFGELKAEPYSSSVFKDEDPDVLAVYLEQLERQRRIVRTHIDNSDDLYWTAAEDFPLYAAVSGREPESIVLKTGLPGEEMEARAAELLNSYVFALSPKPADAAVRLIRRFALFSGPFSMKDLSSVYDMKPEFMREAINILVSNGEILKLKDESTPEECIYCHKRVYERIKHKTVLLARSDIKPKAPEVYCSYLMNKHLITDHVLAPDEKLPEVLKILDGQYFPASWWEDFILPTRIAGYEQKLLDYLCAAGGVKWKGRLSKNVKEVAFYLSRDDEQTGYAPKSEFTMDQLEENILGILDAKGAVFLKDLSKMLALPPADLLAKMERLVWFGIVSNDSFSVARYYMDNEKKNSPWTKYNTYPNMGRWYRCAEYDCCTAKTTEEYVNALLERYGIVSREVVNHDKGAYSWAEIYTWLKDNEFTSGIKRGFYISGLSSIQFARSSDIDMLRSIDDRQHNEEYVTLCCCDPTNPYKDILASSIRALRLQKVPSNAIVFRNGEPVLVIREYGHTIQPLTDNKGILEKAASSFTEAYQNRRLWVGRKNIFTEYWKDTSGDDEYKIEDCHLYEILQQYGFDRGYSGLTLWKKAL